VRAGPLHLLATWFGVGRLPGAPGTFGTLAAVPLAFMLWMPGGAWPLPLAALVVTAIGVVASAGEARASGLKDPQHVVIDEVAGYLIACSFGPPGWRCALLAFVFFRIFDIWKPAPLQRLESLPGGWGVMADDVGAGLLAGVLTWASFGIAGGWWRGPFS
jgi:phosphatidylglycerophosphatase A